MKIHFSCPPDLFDVLPRPQLAKRTTPDWYRAMPMENPLPGGGEDLTVKHCMPFVDALTHSFIIPPQADLHVHDGRFTWDWDWPESPLGLHFPMPWVDEDFEGTLPAGTPVAQCVPVKRDRIDLEFAPMTAAEYTEAKALKQRIKAERGYYKTHIRQRRP